MPTLRQLSRDFSAQTRQRGEEYFRQGRVSLVHATNQSAYARVRGSTTYVVEIQWDDDGIVDAACTCPYFEDHLEPCKHIWATLLEAESVGHLAGSGGGGSRGPTKSAAPPIPEWKRQLERVRHRMEEDARAGYVEKPAATWPPDRQVNYILDIPSTLLEGTSNLVIELATQRLKDGHWDRPKRSKFAWDEWMSIPDETDRQALQMLLGARDSWEYAYRAERQFVLPAGPAGETVLRTMCRTGRCKVRARPDDKDPKPVDFDDAPPWEFRLRVEPGNDAGQMTLTGRLTRDDQSMDITEPAVVLRGGLMIARGRVSRLNHAGAFDLLAMLREGRHIDVPKSDAGALVEELYRLPRPPAMELPDELRMEERRPPIQPVLKVKATTPDADRLSADLTYEYDSHSVTPGEKGAAIFDSNERRVIRRDPHAEANAWQRLMRAGFKLDWDYVARRQGLMVPAAKFAKAVRGLVAEGWRVEADGKLWRPPPAAPSVSVTSGIDWFELDAKIDFGGGASASLPRLLAALRKGDETILLDDGSTGVLPEEWLRKYAPLANLGQEHDGKLRFAATQVGFLDALLASTPEATWDEAFDKARRRLADFTGIRPVDPPKSFTGQLRPYQKDALGWLAFLREFGFGGCLADDMGLGKTVVVLAMLAARKGKGPSLVVAPRSLVFNWAQEAKRFAPKLRVLDHTPAGRTRATDAVAGHDLVLTTYGTLRRDAGYLKDVRFDYVVLDESQAIKNASTASAKACKLLKADHRLALSGTPIENHLGELWSLLDFLNPGMLGTSAAFRHWTGGAAAPADDAARRTLATAIRPFVLRRTKKQVAKDLPERTEQTIWCELDAPQRKLYDELRDHYRASLLERVQKEGINKAKIQILEALLRLRQAACHPGLIDPKRAADPSAKFEALFADLDELMDEGHKVLVFSQFTSLLALVKNHLDARKLPYEYLDGKTKDRQARVERFQNDPAIKLFLISLKAGGVGLNLTAADYVFLLDPWWNPAAEAQAVDRAHRIGQTRNVFAYRLIARDTVEEKVLELQQTKRDLADAIITADNALIAKLGREDLERLLS